MPGMTPTTSDQTKPTVHAPHPILDRYYDNDEDKRRFIRTIFDSTAQDYDRVDRLLAFGTGSWYRRRALVRAGLAPGAKVLDVAVGTGLLAREMVNVLGTNAGIIGIDPSPGMMSAASSPLSIQLIQGRAEALPFAAGSFDFLSLGFALRHLEDLEAVFAEFRRVLRPGGRVLLLEITRAEGWFANTILRAYMRGVVPLLSRTVAKHRDTPLLYQYYWDTIESCAPPAQVLATLAAAGFSGTDRHVELGIFSEFRGYA
jgi:demethylmenaquinone methyltransferase / 2-methoxy-6-polyprenyl-1,4-benzoquinol methylase